MKSIITFILLQLLNSHWAVAQCDKKILWHSARQEMITPEGKTEEVKTDSLLITTTKTSITIAVKGKNEPFIASIKETICEWPEMYITGRTSYKIAFTAPSGRSGEGTIAIERKDKKLFIFFVLPRFGGKKMKIEIDRYEESK